MVRDDSQLRARRPDIATHTISAPYLSTQRTMRTIANNRAPPPMTPTELARFVRQVEIKTRGLSSQVFSGEYQAAFRGRGMSFSEVRTYQPGDDVRDIDWNVTARTGTPHVKIFEEERELTVLIVADASASMRAGTRGQSKRRLATELAAVLGSAALNNNDKVGGVLFGAGAAAERPMLVPPKKGFQHVLRIVREMVAAPEDGTAGGDLPETLRFVDRVMRRRAICFVVSDFLAPGDYRTPLRVLARRHDVVGLQLTDAFEDALPDVGLLQLEDPETGQRRLVDTSDENTRLRHALYYRRAREAAAQEFRQAGAQLLELRCGGDYVRRLLAFFQQRHKLRS